METIGIRELRQHASRYLARVKAGATIAITERGRPIARIVPVDPDEDGRTTLIATGALVPATEPWPDIDVDRLETGDISTVLNEMRDDR